MSAEDFDLPSLADYLHLDLARVTRMVERGQIPARRVAGAWRCSRAELHHWLEQRLGGLDEPELAQLESALIRSAQASDEEWPLAELLSPVAVAMPLDGKTRTAVISAMVQLACDTGLLWDGPGMTEAVRAREDLCPTSLDNGVALLHPRRPLAAMLSQPLIACGRTERGIPFGAPGGALTDIFFLICSVDDRGHLRTLVRLGRLLAVPGCLEQLRSTGSSRELHEALLEYDRQLD